MTTINKITMKGFKSFAKKVEFPLGLNFNCILGPNGSGKSNVCDAICFVLGKISAKGMRAEKSANLIFNGGKHGSPGKDAEVAIYFDNKRKVFPVDDKEVKISRIVKKNGQSIYKINDETRTRQQAVDLLRAANIDPDGHNIILQGDIIRFVQLKSEERRELIEEVAGISVFEEKKEKSMKELEKVQEKLNEADIILTEREKTLSDLKKDRDQAIKFKELEKNINRNKATRINLLMKEREEKKAKVESELNGYKKNIESIQKSIDSLRTEAQNKRAEIEKINEELKEKGDKQQRELSNEIGNLKEDIVRITSRKDVCDNEIRKINERKKQLQNNFNEINKSLQGLQSKKESSNKRIKDLTKREEELNQEISKFKKELGLEGSDIHKKLEALEAEIDEKDKLVQEAEISKQEALRDKDRIEFAIESLNKKLEEVSNLKEEDTQRIKKLKENRVEFKNITQSLSKALNESSVFSVQLSNSRNRLMEGNEELAKLRIRNIGIHEAAAGDRAIQKLKSMNIQGVHGTVSELGQVNSKYSLALEVAAGGRIRSMVVSNEAVAAKCIQILKESKTGVVTFLPLNKLKERVIDQDAQKLKGSPGVQGLALDLVSYDSKYKNVFKYVFGSTMIVDDLGTARKIGIGRARMVSLDGDLVEPSGAMVGGHRRKTGIGFKEKELDSGITKLELEISKLSEQVKLLEGKKTKNEEEIIGLRERKALLEFEIKSAEAIVGSGESSKELMDNKKELDKKLSAITKELSEIGQDCDNYRGAIQKLKLERNEIRNTITQASNKASESPLGKLEDEKQSIREELIKLNSEVSGLTNQFNMFNSEKEKSDSILLSHEKELEEFKKELEELQIKIKDSKNLLKEKENEQKQFYSNYQSLFNNRSKLEKQIQVTDTNIIRQEERVRSIEHKSNDISVRAALINGELEGLKKEFEAYQDVQLRRSMSLGDLNAEIRNFEDTLKKMGNVNLRALEIYEKVNEEYKVLLGKYDTLKNEKEDVLGLMYEIESKKKAVFMKTFNAVKRRFQDVFSTLYTKGDSNLMLEDEEDPFNGGVDIQVRMAGKKAMDIHSLSGGEKTLAALSFIFAIQEFNPAAFYLLDEVDAALDKKNSELLSKLIAKYSNKAQYLVISHNDAIINEADKIYGVSMQDGVSKVVSLKI